MLKEIISSIKTFFKQFFCNHHYYFQGQIKCTYTWEDAGVTSQCPIAFFECIKCGKRIIIRKKPKWYYNDTILEEIDLWRKGQLDINFNSFPENEKDKRECE